MSNEWTARTLQNTLRQNSVAERVIVVSNREPCLHDLDVNGSIVERHPPSGLVTALDPVMRATGGTWIAHGSGTADRGTVDGRDHIQIACEGGAYTLRRVWLTRAEERGYYHGFANSGLWPLCHIAFEAPSFHRSDWRHYQDVNRRFADAVVSEADTPRPVVLVQDYHLALLPRLLRERLPNATIVAFWHIPWPNVDRLARLPYQAELLDGLLGSDILGFQTAGHVRNFLDGVERVLGANVDWAQRVVASGNESTAVRAYPISVEWPSRWAPSTPPVEECRQTVRAGLRIERDAPMMISVDRLDYTKGIEERLASIRRLLSRGSATVGRPVFVQIAAPSRTRLACYRDLHARVLAQVRDLNTRFGDESYRPVVLVDRQVEAPEVFRFFRAADACHVNSLDDGMNLVAKEFVSARDDEQGVLALSRFAGAAGELAGALLFNPYDLDGAADSLADALTMAPAQQAERMRAMRAQVARHNVYRWAGRLLLDAAGARSPVADAVSATG
jgi:trehalose 6-phosphate synthase